MDCPKCGTPHDDGIEECSACGVVFERWRAAQERAILQRHVTRSQPLVVPQRGVPLWMIAVGLVMAVLLGTAWTAKSRAARQRRDAEAKNLVNEINNKVVAAAMRAAAASARAQGRDLTAAEQRGLAFATSANATTLQWPDGLNETSAREMLERCSSFTVPYDIAMPKIFPRSMRSEMLRDFVWLGRAIRNGYATLDETSESGRDAIVVKISPTAWAQLPITDVGNMYQLRMGRPRITEFTSLTKSSDVAHADFAWTYESGKGAALIADRDQYVGNVTFNRTGSAWSVKKATIGSGEWKTQACD
jgi:hypothetical protein